MSEDIEELRRLVDALKAEDNRAESPILDQIGSLCQRMAQARRRN